MLPVSGKEADAGASVASAASSTLILRGDRVRIISGKHKGATGTIAASVFQRSVDLPDEHTPCYHVLLDCELVVTVNVKQVEALI